jgi:membrane protease YdiL (CAAX protease family)
MLAIPVWCGVYFWLQSPLESNIQRQAVLQIVFWAVLIYPVLEELGFRGFIQSYLMSKSSFQKKSLGLSLANWITSLAFTLLHVVVQQTLLALLIYFPSLVFGYFRDRYNSTLPAIFLHVLYNLGWFTALWLARLD